MFSKVCNLINKIGQIYWRFIASPEKYARHLGVKIGKNCLIATHNWPSEAYLITIGDNVQITNNVSIYTHGGGNSIRKKHPDFDVFGKVVIGDWAYIGAFSQIMPGVTIGEGAMIGAGSVVTKDITVGELWIGNLAKFIKKINE